MDHVLCREGGELGVISSDELDIGSEGSIRSNLSWRCCPLQGFQILYNLVHMQSSSVSVANTTITDTHCLYEKLHRNLDYIHHQDRDSARTRSTSRFKVGVRSTFDVFYDDITSGAASFRIN
ncbi:hypothetical protein L208DRAFT_1417411 [Tricholoma matsutake]|nr:hypothetical protein L208DRAFT_1417411 [Tricholoma matsutake 945]